VVLPELTPDRLRAAIERIAAMSAMDRFEAKRRAGEVFRTWRRGNHDRNILEQVQVALRTSTP